MRVTPAHTLLNVTHTQKVTRPPGDLPTQIPHPVIYGSLLYTCLVCVPPAPLACSIGPLENTHGRPFPILRPSAGNFFSQFITALRTTGRSDTFTCSLWKCVFV